MQRSLWRLAACAALLAGLTACGRKTRETAELPDQTPRALKKFDENKFGMFIHWGLYAIPAGEWKGQYVRGIGEWIMNRAKIPVKEYEQLAKQFNPVKFNAGEWAQVARDAGMKYVVITSKHHDGFAMYGSKASKYNIVDDTPFARDPMKDLSAACAADGLGFGFYYSQDQDWHEPNGRGNTWDFPGERNSGEYLQNKVMPQVKEILTGYGQLSLIWFDTPGMLSDQQVTDLRRMVKTLQPMCLINSRIGHGKGDYLQTGDNAIPIQVYSKTKWEVPATLNDTWGFKKNDHNWKDPADLIAKLADIVSKGGNYLLNVGPTAEGLIPEESQNILRTIGKWLAVNGESIYGTSASPFYFPDITWRCTVKPGKVYLHLINWPGRNFRFEGLESEVKKAYLLADGKDVPYKREGNTLAFTLPETPVDPYDSVLALDIADETPRVAAGFANNTLPAKLDLYAWTARLRGEEIRYDKKSMAASNFKKADTEKNELWWYPYESLEGNYSVEITYACDAKAAGSGFRIAAHKGNQGTPRAAVEGRIENTGGQYVTRKAAGALQVARDDQLISFSLPDDDKSSSVRIRRITLIRGN
ncbi:MAG: alpha-L-fucosidase [Bryobacterales bacterium]|nr:alpha-L-fucosidase [Bryobacterales bacterium]